HDYRAGDALGDERGLRLARHRAEGRMGDELIRWRTASLLALATLATACQHDAPKQYPLHGQILVVDTAHQQLTIKHDEIAGFMPAMTMSYPVASPKLLEGRTPGEMVTATLEVADATGRLTEIQHTGSAPLPTGSNAVAMAAGLLNVGDEMPD